MSSDPSFHDWTGRTVVSCDESAPAPLAMLAAMLDHDVSPWLADEVPPLGHWLYFLNRAHQSALGEDGHPHGDGLLPPAPLPRRMWAGGRIDFVAPLPVGQTISRRSMIAEVNTKTGRSGGMVFVTIAHEISDAAGRLCITERQDIVYRGGTAGSGSAAPPAAMRAAHASCLVTIDPMLLFRYSALTFNAHRIHYDRDYARTREGYPGLVVHGPLQATLLADHFIRETPGARLATFEYRARRPLFDGAPMGIHLARDRDAAELWTSGPDGYPAMTAIVRTA